MFEIRSEHILIRSFSLSDAAAFTELIRDKMMQPDAIYDERMPTETETLEKLVTVFAAGDEFFAVCLHSGELIGFIALARTDAPRVRTLAYCIRSDMRGKGYGSESVRTAISLAAKLDTYKLTAGTAIANTPSIRLLSSLGFKKTDERDAVFAIDENGNPIVHYAAFFEYSCAE